MSKCSPCVWGYTFFPRRPCWPTFDIFDQLAPVCSIFPWERHWGTGAVGGGRKPLQHLFFSASSSFSPTPFLKNLPISRPLFSATNVWNLTTWLCAHYHQSGNRSIKHPKDWLTPLCASAEFVHTPAHCHHMAAINITEQAAAPGFEVYNIYNQCPRGGQCPRGAPGTCLTNIPKC